MWPDCSEDTSHGTLVDPSSPWHRTRNQGQLWGLGQAKIGGDKRKLEWATEREREREREREIMQRWRLLISINLISSTKAMKPTITRKVMSRLLIQPSCSEEGQTQAEWHTFEKLIRDKCMKVRFGWTDRHTFVSYLYDSQVWVDWLPYICLLFVWQ